MKTMKQSTLLLFLIAKILFLNSCDSPIDSDEIDESQYKEFITELGIEGNLKSLERIESILAVENSNLMNTDTSNIYVGINPQRVSLYQEVKSLFDPDNQLCPVPEKIAKKLRKQNKKKKKIGFIPKFVMESLKPLADTVILADGVALTTLIHWMKVIDTDGKEFQNPIMSAPTYLNFDVTKFLMESSFSSFIYNLDCSGYLTASIEAVGSAPGSDIAAKASASLDKQNSMVIAGGTIASPLLIAIRPNLFPPTMLLDSTNRIKTINSILSAIPSNYSDSTIIELNYTHDVVWSSNRGAKSFNGKGEFGVNASANFGLAKAGGAINTKNSISRSSSYTAYKTYIAQDSRLKLPNKITLKEIKELKTNLTK